MEQSEPASAAKPAKRKRSKNGSEIKLLQEATYSEKDRLHIAHSEYISQEWKDHPG
jgi:hypothetical protein